MLQLGRRARDVVTGFEGVITARVQHLTGCDQYSLVPDPKDEEQGRTVPKGEWFDENRLQLMPSRDGDEMIRGLRHDGVAPTPVAAGGPQRDMPTPR